MSIEFIIIVVLVLVLACAPKRRGGCRVNDLSRWKAFGGHLDRPAPPAPFKCAEAKVREEVRIIGTGHPPIMVEVGKVPE